MHDDRPARPAELRALTGLRFIAAAAVVVFHFLRDAVPGSWPIARDLAASGFTAVSLFFVLSGFVLAYSYQRTPLEGRTAVFAFLRARFARVYPVYLVGLATGAIASHDVTGSLYWTKTVLALLLLNAWTHIGMFHLNWAAWSLSAEAFFYLLFPSLLLRARRASDALLLSATLAAWCVELAVAVAYDRVDPDRLGRPLALGDEVLWSWYLKFSPWMHAPEFIVGIAAGVLFVRHAAAVDRASARARWIGVATALTAIAIVAALAAWQRAPYAVVHSGLYAPAFAVLIALLAFGRGAIAKALASAPLVALGRASYAIYILHVPLFLVLARSAPALWTSPILFAPYAGLLVGLSLAVHHAVEEPARKWLRAFRVAKTSA